MQLAMVLKIGYFFRGACNGTLFFDLEKTNMVIAMLFVIDKGRQVC
jgi:hypothetical protein